MTDIASLSFDIDSSQAQRAVAVLETLRATSVQVDQSTQKLNANNQVLSTGYAQQRDQLTRLAEQTKAYDGTLIGLTTHLNEVKAGFSAATGPGTAYTAMLEQGATVAASLNSSFEGMQRFVQTQKALGATTSDLAQGLERMTAALRAQTVAGVETRRELELLGVSFRGLSFDRPDAVLRQLGERLRQYKDDAAKLDTVARVLGPAAAQDPVLLRQLQQPTYQPFWQRRSEERQAQAAGAVDEQNRTVERSAYETGRSRDELSDLYGRYTQSPTFWGRAGLNIFGPGVGQSDRQSLERLREISQQPDAANNERYLFRARNWLDQSQAGQAVRNLRSGQFSANQREIGERQEIEAFESPWGRLRNYAPSAAAIAQTAGSPIGQAAALLLRGQSFESLGRRAQNLVGGYTPLLQRDNREVSENEREFLRQQSGGILANLGDPRLATENATQQALTTFNRSDAADRYRIAYGDQEGSRRFVNQQRTLEQQRDYARAPERQLVDDTRRQAYLLSLAPEQRERAGYFIRNLPTFRASTNFVAGQSADAVTRDINPAERQAIEGGFEQQQLGVLQQTSENTQREEYFLGLAPEQRARARFLAGQTQQLGDLPALQRGQGEGAITAALQPDQRAVVTGAFNQQLGRQLQETEEDSRVQIQFQKELAEALGRGRAEAENFTRAWQAYRQAELSGASAADATKTALTSVSLALQQRMTQGRALVEQMKAETDATQKRLDQVRQAVTSDPVTRRAMELSLGIQSDVERLQFEGTLPNPRGGEFQGQRIEAPQAQTLIDRYTEQRRAQLGQQGVQSARDLSSAANDQLRDTERLGEIQREQNVSLERAAQLLQNEVQMREAIAKAAASGLKSTQDEVAELAKRTAELQRQTAVSRNTTQNVTEARSIRLGTMVDRAIDALPRDQQDAARRNRDAYIRTLETQQVETPATGIPPEGQRLLDNIAPSEARGFDVWRQPGGGQATFNPYGPPPTKGHFGQYQFDLPTWQTSARAAGVDPNYASPENQKAAAWALAQERYRRNTGGDILTALRTQGSGMDIARGLVGTWPSLTGGSQENKIGATFAQRLDSGAPGTPGAPVFTQQSVDDFVRAQNGQPPRPGAVITPSGAAPATAPGTPGQTRAPGQPAAGAPDQARPAQQPAQGVPGSAAPTAFTLTGPVTITITGPVQQTGAGVTSPANISPAGASSVVTSPVPVVTTPVPVVSGQPASGETSPAATSAGPGGPTAETATRPAPIAAPPGSPESASGTPAGTPATTPPAPPTRNAEVTATPGGSSATATATSGGATATVTTTSGGAPGAAATPATSETRPPDTSTTRVDTGRMSQGDINRSQRQIAGGQPPTAIPGSQVVTTDPNAPEGGATRQVVGRPGPDPTGIGERGGAVTEQVRREREAADTRERQDFEIRQRAAERARRATLEQGPDSRIRREAQITGNPDLPADLRQRAVERQREELRSGFREQGAGLSFQSTQSTQDMQRQIDAYKQGAAAVAELDRQLQIDREQRQLGSDVISRQTRELQLQTEALTRQELAYTQRSFQQRQEGDVQRAINNAGPFASPSEQRRVGELERARQDFAATPGLEQSPAGQQRLRDIEQQKVLDEQTQRMGELRSAAQQTGQAFGSAFSQLVVHGAKGNDVLKQLLTTMSDIAVKTFVTKPAEKLLQQGADWVFKELFGDSGAGAPSNQAGGGQTGGTPAAGGSAGGNQSTGLVGAITNAVVGAGSGGQCTCPGSGVGGALSGQALNALTGGAGGAPAGGGTAGGVVGTLLTKAVDAATKSRAASPGPYIDSGNWDSSETPAAPSASPPSGDRAEIPAAGEAVLYNPMKLALGGGGGGAGLVGTLLKAVTGGGGGTSRGAGSASGPGGGSVDSGRWDTAGEPSTTPGFYAQATGGAVGDSATGGTGVIQSLFSNATTTGGGAAGGGLLSPGGSLYGILPGGDQALSSGAPSGNVMGRLIDGLVGQQGFYQNGGLLGRLFGSGSGSGSGTNSPASAAGTPLSNSWDSLSPATGGSATGGGYIDSGTWDTAANGVGDIGGSAAGASGGGVLDSLFSWFSSLFSGSGGAAGASAVAAFSKGGVFRYAQGGVPETPNPVEPHARGGVFRFAMGGMPDISSIPEAAPIAGPLPFAKGTVFRYAQGGIPGGVPDTPSPAVERHAAGGVFRYAMGGMPSIDGMADVSSAPVVMPEAYADGAVVRYASGGLLSPGGSLYGILPGADPARATSKISASIMGRLIDGLVGQQGFYDKGGLIGKWLGTGSKDTPTSGTPVTPSTSTAAGTAAPPVAGATNASATGGGYVETGGGDTGDAAGGDGPPDAGGADFSSTADLGGTAVGANLYAKGGVFRYARGGVFRHAMGGMPSPGAVDEMAVNPEPIDTPVPYAKGGMFRFARGGSLGVEGHLGDFSSQVITRPTMFHFAGGARIGQMGEAGPEAVMPLVRHTNGQLGVRAEDGQTVLPLTRLSGGSLGVRRMALGEGIENGDMIPFMSSGSPGLQAYDKQFDAGPAVTPSLSEVGQDMLPGANQPGGRAPSSPDNDGRPRGPANINMTVIAPDPGAFRYNQSQLQSRAGALASYNSVRNN